MVVIGWTLYGLFMAAQSYVVNARAGRPILWSAALFGEMTYAALWALLTPLILALARKFQLTRSNLRTTIPLHLGASVAMALVHKSVHTLIHALYRGQTEGFQLTSDYFFRNLMSYFDYGIPLYWIIILLNYAFDYYGRYKENELKAAQLESQLAQAQLQSLKMQLHPHFLFNTLNAISVLIQKNPELARRTVGRLSELLRYTLDNVGVQKVTLREELEFLDRYLQIEQTRFGDRLSIATNIADAALEAAVPNMILQPLVENAIKHGISKRRGRASIEVSAAKENGGLRLIVKDNGVGLSENGEIHEGVGLSSTRARLKELYGERQSFELESVLDGGAKATVVIPFES